MKRLFYPAGTWLLKGLGLLAAKCSRQTILKLSHLAGDFIFFVLGIRRRLVLDNLAASFPDKDPREIRSIARKVYQNQVFNFAELLRVPLIRNPEDASLLMSIDSAPELGRILDRESGAVIVSGHYGSWEVLAVCFGLLYRPVHLVVKSIRNRSLDSYITSLRTWHGNTVIHKKKALRQGLNVLRNRGILLIMADQSNKKKDYYLSFLNRRASVFLGPAYLALKAEVPMYAVFCRRDEKGQYRVTLRRVQTSDLSCTREDIRTLARRYTLLLEEFIISYPQEWLWLHNRWKHSPQARTDNDLC